MKTFISFITACAFLASCSTPKEQAKRIAPIPVDYTASEMTDGAIPAAFSASDFNWTGKTLHADIYRETFYKSDDIKTMHIGDTLVYEGKPMVVAKIEKESGTISVNGGVEEGGAWLNADKSGKFRATTLDDHSIYDKLGATDIPLDGNFSFIDCGVNPSDPYDTVSVKQQQHIESLKDYKRNFSPIDTRIYVKKGRIEKIVRHWIP